jgi:guanylate kinase
MVVEEVFHGDTGLPNCTISAEGPDRMHRAGDEIDHWAEYDYVLVNRDMDACLAKVWAIVSAERSKRVRQTDLNEFVRDLVGPAH